MTSAGASTAAIFGCSGPGITADERAFFAETRPWGFILFARNVETPDQVRRLVADLREAAGHDAPVLIDQEGGRVARLRAPHWREWPALPDELALLDADAREAAVRARYAAIGQELADLGIDVNCVPMLDVPVPGAHEIITSRVLGNDPAEIGRLGAVASEALKGHGVLPVIKHIPGHGRASDDSHEGLPRVGATLDELRATDFAPFRALNTEALGMTAHVVYDAIDPDRPATLSTEAIRLVREEIGFDGVLMTDDISMGALEGPMPQRVRDAFAAGCDMILHCNGELGEMREIAAHTPRLSGAPAARADRAIAARDAALARAKGELRNAG